MSGHQHDMCWFVRPSTVTQGLHWWYPGLEECQPEGDLSYLSTGAVGQAEHDHMDAVGVANEVIIQHVVVVMAGELPDTAVSNSRQIDLLDINTSGVVIL